MNNLSYVVKYEGFKTLPSNRVITSKYSIINFLPKNLFEQLTRFANVYFIMIVILNWIPTVNAFGKEIAMIPVIGVLLATAVKDLYEDVQRHLCDRKVNKTKVLIFR